MYWQVRKRQESWREPDNISDLTTWFQGMNSTHLAQTHLGVEEIVEEVR